MSRARLLLSRRNIARTIVRKAAAMAAFGESCRGSPDLPSGGPVFSRDGKPLGRKALIRALGRSDAHVMARRVERICSHVLGANAGIMTDALAWAGTFCRASAANAVI
jgi:hypothetical protein